MSIAVVFYSLDTASGEVETCAPKCGGATARARLRARRAVSDTGSPARARTAMWEEHRAALAGRACTINGLQAPPTATHKQTCSPEWMLGGDSGCARRGQSCQTP